MQRAPEPATSAPNLLSPIGYRNSSCGYCHNGSGSFSYYASSKTLSPSFYEALLNRGWRRSGTLLYKPDQRASCCPHYTIRLDAAGSASSPNVKRDHRQTLNRFSHFVLGNDYITSKQKLHPKNKEEKRKYKQVFDLVERVHEPEAAYQSQTVKLKQIVKTTEKNDVEKENGGPTGEEKRRGNDQKKLEPEHKLEVSLEPDVFTEEKYLLFENYQRLVHHEPSSRISRSGFRNFLCSSPLLRTPFSSHTKNENGNGSENGNTSSGITETKNGSYHHTYRLDGVLVAFAVLDLLPNSVSAVYFIYHSSISSWRPGKLSALREIALTVETGRTWYMMGFYIEGCAKMRYKSEFRPQWVLDPETYDWRVMDDELKTKLKQGKYVSLSSERGGGLAGANDRQEGERTDADPPATNEAGISGAVTSSPASELENKDEDLDLDSDSEDDFEDDYQGIGERRSLTAINMPGILPLSALTPSTLDNIKLRIGSQDAVTGDLVSWESSSASTPGSIKSVIADLVSAVGLEASREMVVYFE